jgi:predicted transcriptional regulator
MARNFFDQTEDVQPAADPQSSSDQFMLEELDLLRDVHRGLADVEAGRVVPHDEARARLLARYE